MPGLNKMALDALDCHKSVISVRSFEGKKSLFKAKITPRSHLSTKKVCKTHRIPIVVQRECITVKGVTAILCGYGGVTSLMSLSGITAEFTSLILSPLFFFGSIPALRLSWPPLLLFSVTHSLLNV